MLIVGAGGPAPTNQLRQAATRSGAARVVRAQTRTTEPPAGGVPQVAVVLVQHARRAEAQRSHVRLADLRVLAAGGIDVRDVGRTAALATR